MAVNKASMRNGARGGVVYKDYSPQVILTTPTQPNNNVPRKIADELERKIENLMIIIEKQRIKIENVAYQKAKYQKTAKGKLAQKRASAKYWQKVRSGRKPGRPKKS